MKLSASLSSIDEERECMSRVPYADVVGSLMYSMVCKRPNISHAVGVVSTICTILVKGIGRQ